jgi:release factor glutamine methyltransferase
MEYHKVVEPDERARYRELARRRAAGEPAAYIVGRRAFWTLDLEVTPDVLIPRPETECVVEAALERASPRDRPVAIVDLGTGSGNIAVALAKELTGATILAVDISGPAVEVARRNAERCGVGERVEVLEGDLFEPVRRKGWPGRVELLVSNPPYVRPDEGPSLPRDVRDFEPVAALFDRGDGDGLGMYRRILREGGEFLAPRGVAILELGAGLSGPVRALAEENGFRVLAIRQDLAGIDRVIVLGLADSSPSGAEIR